MWKRPEEISAHNASQGRGEKYDPFQWVNTLVVEVETVWLEGEHVVLAGCCESARARREDVVAWRELPGGDGHASTYEVRLKVGADIIVQRAAKASREQPRCPRCGRSWDGLPAARGRDENRPEGDGPRDHGHRHGDECHGHAPCEDREHGGAHHMWHHAHGVEHQHGGPEEHHHHGGHGPHDHE